MTTFFFLALVATCIYLSSKNQSNLFTYNIHLTPYISAITYLESQMFVLFWYVLVIRLSPKKWSYDLFLSNSLSEKIRSNPMTKKPTAFRGSRYIHTIMNTWLSKEKTFVMLDAWLTNKKKEKNPTQLLEIPRRLPPPLLPSAEGFLKLRELCLLQRLQGVRPRWDSDSRWSYGSKRKNLRTTGFSLIVLLPKRLFGAPFLDPNSKDFY